MHPDCLISLGTAAKEISARYGIHVAYRALHDRRVLGKIPQAMSVGRQWRVRFGDIDTIARSVGLIAPQEGGQ